MGEPHEEWRWVYEQGQGESFHERGPPMRHFMVFLVLALLFTGPARADDPRKGALPEPAEALAKEAGNAVRSAERSLLKLADDLKAEASAGASPSEMLESSRKILAACERLQKELTALKAALADAAAHHRGMSELQTGFARGAKSAEIREDYLTVALLYGRKASALEARAASVGVPKEVIDLAQVVSEGNLFLERSLRALSSAAVDAGPLTARIEKQGERVKVLTGRLRETLQAALKEAEAKDVRDALEKALSNADPKGESGSSKGGSAKEGVRLPGEWSTNFALQGVRYHVVVSFSAGGEYRQLLYARLPNGAVGFLGAASGTFEEGPNGEISFFADGTFLERGKMTPSGEGRFVYEVLENRLVPGTAGRRLTLKRLIP